MHGIHRKAFTAFLQGIYEKVSKGVDFVLARKVNTFASENMEPVGDVGED